MARRTYLNKPSGGTREFLGCLSMVLLALGVIIVLLMIAAHFILRDGGELERLDSSEGGISRGGRGFAVGAYFAPSEAEMRYLWNVVRTSPFIVGNKRYSRIVSNIEFKYFPDVDLVNALAARHGQHGLEDPRRPSLYLFGGYVRVSRILALAYAAKLAGDTNSMEQVSGIWKAISENFSDAQMRAFLDVSGLLSVTNRPEILVKARGISSGMILATLAHEAGHHALGHLYGRIDTTTKDVSRNQEREADSFESSVMSTNPFGEFMMMGDLLYYAIDAKLGGGGKTHPYSKERFENLVRGNPSLAAALGLQPHKLVTEEARHGED